MTIKEKIINYLKGKGFVNKGNICKDLTQDDYLYSDSVGRELRRLTKDGVLAKRKAGKGTEYAFKTDNIQRTSSLIEKQKERIQKEEQEKQPTLL